LRSGFQNLALQGLDVLPPAIARVTAGFSALALGSPLMLGVLGAAAALSLAFKAIDSSATRAADNAVAATERMRTNIQAAAQHVDRDVFARRIAETEAQIRALRAAPLPAQRFREIQGAEGPVSIPVGSPAEERAAALAGLENTLRQLTIGLNIATDRGMEPLIRATRELDDALQDLIRDLRIPAGVGGLLTLAPGPAPVAERDPWAFLRVAEERRLRERERLFPDAAAEGALISRRSPFTPEFGVMAAGALMQGVAGGGGVGGFLGAAAGPVAMVNPLAGAIVGGIGGIFSLFDRSEEKRHRELVGKLERIANEVGLERVTVVFTGPDGHQTRKTLAELESGDAVERVPGPVGATG
jgi:hypothetical protein